MAIGLNLSADAIRTATPSPVSQTPATAPERETPRVTKEESELQKAAEREQAAPEEREIVSVSEDGDTVAVRKDNAKETEEDRQGTVTETEREDETKAAGSAEEDEREAEAIEAPELAPVETADVKPMELPDAAKEAIEAAKEDSELKTEAAKETAQKAADEEAEEEEYTEQITSFAGYTKDQIEQMYLDGKISQYDYNREVEAREQRLENIQVSNEELSDKINGLDEIGRNTENMGNAIAAATSDQASQTLSAQQKLDAIDTLTDRDAAEKRKTEDTRVQWDYQLNA